MMTFLVACMLHPEAQKRARDEIDAAVGRDRLPTFEDRPKLPFVDAMCKEVMRWRPVTPLGTSILYQSCTSDISNWVLKYAHDS